MCRLAAGRFLPYALLFCGVARLAADVRENLSRASGLPDFRIYRLAGQAVLHGRSPYEPLGHIHSAATAGFVYPAPAAWVMAPFGVLGFRAGAVCFVVLAAASALAALRLLGVRDLRCYGAALLLMPVSTAVTTGTVSTVLVLAAAIVWRFRNGVVVPALAFAAALMLKPLLWPVLVWCAATRRLRLGALAAGTAAAGIVAAYAALHLDPLTSYVGVIRAATRAEGADSYSIYALVERLGAPAPLLAANALGALLLLALWRASRRDERQGFVVAVGATLALAPILWVHGFALLLVPLVFAAPRLSWLWLAPVLLGPLGLRPVGPPTACVAGVWLVAAAVLAAAWTQDAAGPLARLRRFAPPTAAASAASAESRSTATAPAGVMQ